MGEEDFSSVFGGGAPPGEGAPIEDEELEGEDVESEAAIDAAIDEVFATEDPVARREAFKNAVRMTQGV